MPIYEYQCQQCQQQFDVMQKINDEPLRICESCGGELQKMVSSTSFILKGGGWYVTEYGNRKKDKETAKSAAKTADKSSTSKDSTTGSSAAAA